MTDLLGALSRHYTVVNREMPSTIGVAQVFHSCGGLTASF